MPDEMKESNEIVVKVNVCEDRNDLLTILAINGYEVTCKFVNDIYAGKHDCWVIANKVV